MQCREARNLLESYVLGGESRSIRQRLEAHLAECPRCRAMANESLAIVADLRVALPAHKARPEFAGRLNALARGEIRRASRRRWAWAAAGVAAAALLAVGVTLSARRGAGPQRPDGRAVWVVANTQPDAIGSALRPVVKGDCVYAVRRGSDGGTSVAAVASASGSLCWETPVPGVVSFAVDDRWVLVASGAGEEVVLRALDTIRGCVRWRRRAPAAAVRGPLVLEAGRAFLTVGDSLLAFDAATGRTLWTRAFADGIPTAPVCAAGLVYVATPRGTGREIRCFEAGRALSLRWTRRVGPVGRMLVSDARVYVRTQDIEALDLRTGARVWTVAAQGCGDLTCSDGTLYYVDMAGEGRMLAVDAATGAKVHSYARLRSCSGLTEGCAGWYDAADGQWRKATETPFRFYWRATCGLEDGGNLYLGTDRGLLARLDLKTNTFELQAALADREIVRLAKNAKGDVVALSRPAALGALPARLAAALKPIACEAAVLEGGRWRPAAAGEAPPKGRRISWHFKQLKKQFRRDKSQGNYLLRSGDSEPRLYVTGVFYPKVLCVSADGGSLWLSTYTGLHRISLGDAK